MLRLTPRLVHAAQLASPSYSSRSSRSPAPEHGAAPAPPVLSPPTRSTPAPGATGGQLRPRQHRHDLAAATWTNGKERPRAQLRRRQRLRPHRRRRLARPLDRDDSRGLGPAHDHRLDVAHGRHEGDDRQPHLRSLLELRLGRPAGISTIGNQYTQSITRGPAALPRTPGRHLATTYDGASLRLYVDGALVSPRPSAAQWRTHRGALKIGGNAIWPEWFSGRIDDLRVYNRALTAAEAADGHEHRSPRRARRRPTRRLRPRRPLSRKRLRRRRRSRLSWNASTDNTGVAGYRSFRNGTQIGTGTATSYTFSGLTCGTTTPSLSRPTTRPAIPRAARA